MYLFLATCTGLSLRTTEEVTVLSPEPSCDNGCGLCSGVYLSDKCGCGSFVSGFVTLILSIVCSIYRKRKIMIYFNNHSV